MSEKLKDHNNEILSLLINKQIDKIIEANNLKDCYFSIRQNFDLDQFLWDIATRIYSSIGEKIDFATTTNKIKKCQEFAYVLYAKEQEKQRQEYAKEQERQEQEKLSHKSIQTQKESISKELVSLELNLAQVSDQKALRFKDLLLKILELKKRLRNLLVEEKELILSDINKAREDYNYNLVAELEYGLLESINQDLSRVENEIESRLEEEKSLKHNEEKTKLKHFSNIIKEVKNHTNKEDSLIAILQLLENEFNINYQQISSNFCIPKDLNAGELDVLYFLDSIEELVGVEIPNNLLGIELSGISSCSVQEFLEYVAGKLT